MFGRFATLIKPIMDNIFIDLHFWAIPERLVWDNWQKFNGEQKNPGDTTSFIMPTITSPAVTGYTEGSLHDYIGLPTQVPGFENRTDFLRAYALVWNEWYRDENLQNSTYCPTDDGPDVVGNQILLPRGKRKDYFTSALPFAQKHTPVTLPIGGTAPIIGSADIYRNSNSSRWNMFVEGTNTIPTASVLNVSAAGELVTAQYLSMDPNNGIFTDFDAGTRNAFADLSAATAVTINALREAVTVQQLYELDARGGTRYTEIIRAHFGVVSPDARLQRPEYLGGATSYINVSPIAQTAPTAAGITPQGNLSAMATTSMHEKGFVKSFTEHTIIIGMVSVRADLNYQQGLDRKWSRSTRFDFYWPSFANLGEQTIPNKEIYVTGTSTDDDLFGYAERFSEYRYKNSIITGQFRSNSALSLDVWHLAQEFSSLPSLNFQFIQEQPPIDRVIAVTDQPAIILDCFFDEIWARPMPTFSTPGLTKF